MAQRKNMLEAFHRVEDDGAPAKEAPKPAPKARPAGPPREFPLRPGGVPFPRWMGWVAAVVVAFGLGVLVGRGGDVVAGTGEDQERSQEPATPDGGGEHRAAAPAGLAPSSAAAQEPEAQAPADPDAALVDPANRYTIVVITYGRGGADLAWGTHDHLAAAGVPVFRPRQVQDDHIVVVAGAAPTAAELEELLKRIKALGRDGRRGIYGDAYIAKKDAYL